MTCPDMVPTAEEDRPEARRDTANIQLEALPRIGVRVRWASSIVPISLNPEEWNVEADMINMAALIRPATPIARTTSTISKWKSRFNWVGL